MKKSLISLGLLSALAFSVNAQDAAPAPSGSEFKPSAGNVTVEVLATSPFAGSGNPFQLSGSETGIPSLRFRYFINEKMAFRLNFSIDAAKYNQDLGSKQDATFNQSGTTSTTTGSASNTPIAYKLSSNKFLVAIAPGLEFHKSVSERMSVYYGAYIDFAMQSAKGKITGTPGSNSSSSTTTPTTGTGSSTSENTSTVAGEYSYEVKGQNLGALDDLESPAAPFSTTVSPSFGTSKTGDNLRNDGDRAFTRLGLVGVIGADYYITKALYLGLEVSWGYTNTMYKKVTVEEKVTNINSVTTGTNPDQNPPATPADVVSGSFKTEENKDNNWNVAPAVNAAFRLGFWF